MEAQEIKSQVLAFIDELANRLQVPAEALWGVLIKQQYVEAGLAVVSAAYCLGVLALLFWLVPKLWNQADKIPNIGYGDDDPLLRHGAKMFITAGSVLLALLYLSGTKENVKDVIRYSVNPEYQALQVILKVGK